LVRGPTRAHSVKINYRQLIDLLLFKFAFAFVRTHLHDHVPDLVSVRRFENVPQRSGLVPFHSLDLSCVDVTFLYDLTTARGTFASGRKKVGLLWQQGRKQAALNKCTKNSKRVLNLQFR